MLISSVSEVILFETVRLSLTSNTPVTLVLSSKSISPVPLTLSSKFALLAVVEILFPAMRMSSVLIGPPKYSLAVIISAVRVSKLADPTNKFLHCFVLDPIS